METCEWKYIDDGKENKENHYRSGCGGTWFFFEGTLKENHMHECPFCGETIQERESVPVKNGKF